MQHQWERKHARKVARQQWRVKSANAFLNVLLRVQRRKAKDSYRVARQRGSVMYHSQKLKALKRLPGLRESQHMKVHAMAQMEKEARELKRQLAAGGDIEAIKAAMTNLRARYSAAVME